MKTKATIVTAVVIALAAVGSTVHLVSRSAEGGAIDPSPPGTAVRVPSPPGTAVRVNSESEKPLRGDFGRRELPRIASAIQEQQGTDAGGRFGVSADGEIELGETLVTGGNLGPNGSHEFTLITPKLVQLPDGQQGAEVVVRMIGAGPSFIEENKLKSIGQNAHSTLQVAEAWRPDRTKQVLERMSQLDDSVMLSAPRIVSPMGQAFSVSIGDLGGSSYTLHGTLSLADSGAVRVQSRLERSIESKPE